MGKRGISTSSILGTIVGFLGTVATIISWIFPGSRDFIDRHGIAFSEVALVVLVLFVLAEIGRRQWRRQCLAVQPDARDVAAFGCLNQELPAEYVIGLQDWLPERSRSDALDRLQEFAERWRTDPH